MVCVSSQSGGSIGDCQRLGARPPQPTFTCSGDEAQEQAAARVDDLASDAERHKVTGLALSLALPLLEVNDDAKGNPLGSRLPKCYGVPV